MMNFLSRLLAFCSRPRALLFAIGAGVVLAMSSLASGLFYDDYLILAQLSDNRLPFLGDGPLDIYVFAPGTPEKSHGLQTLGILPWWADPMYRHIAYHPLAAVTHALDMRLWPHSPLLMHLVNVGWYAVLLAAAWTLYRRLIGARPIAVLALLLYAIESTHGTTVSWLSARNALMATAFGILTVTAHHIWTVGKKPLFGLIAAGLLALSVFSAELGVSAGCFLVAHALWIEEGPLTRRVVRLFLYAPVALLWILAWLHVGAGDHASRIYIDPVHQPIQYLAALGARLPVLAHAFVFHIPWADLWIVYEWLGDIYRAPHLVAALIGLTIFGIVLAPLVREDKTVRFWITGFLLSLFPVSAGAVTDRQLTFAGIAGAAVLAQFFAWAAAAARPRLVRVIIPVLLLVHIPLSAIEFVGRSFLIPAMNAPFIRADESLPDNPSLSERTLILVNAQASGFIYNLPFMRVVRGEMPVGEMRALATSFASITLTRTGERTARITAPEGLIQRSELHLHVNPFRVAESITIEGMRVTVRAVTDDGRPSDAEYGFDEPLDSPRYRWFEWRHRGFVEMRAPAIGETRQFISSKLDRELEGE